MDGITRIEWVNGEKVDMMAANSCILGGFVCVWLPLALDTWKDVKDHRSYFGALLGARHSIPDGQMQMR